MPRPTAGNSEIFVQISLVGAERKSPSKTENFSHPPLLEGPIRYRLNVNLSVNVSVHVFSFYYAVLRSGLVIFILH